MRENALFPLRPSAPLGSLATRSGLPPRLLNMLDIVPRPTQIGPMKTRYAVPIIALL